QCHNNNPDVHDRTNGRIFKIAYGDTKTTKVDWQKKSDKELISNLFDNNDWWSRHARRILQERSQAGTLSRETKMNLRNLLLTHSIEGWGNSFPTPDGRYIPATEQAELRYLWALHAIDGLNEA